MGDITTEDIQARIVAGQILSRAAQRSSAAMDSFSGWLLIGFGASFALLFSHLDTLINFIPLAHFKLGGVFYLGSAVLAVADKFLAAFVAAGASSASDGEELGKQLAASGVELNFPEMLREVQKGLLWPWSTVARYMADAALSGDHAVAGRVHTRTSQIQGYIVVLQAMLCIAAAVIVLYGAVI